MKRYEKLEMERLQQKRNMRKLSPKEHNRLRTLEYREEIDEKSLRYA